MGKLDFSLIVPVRGKQEDLDAFLVPVRSFSRDGSWELIVIDDHSDEVLELDGSIGTIIRAPSQSGAAVSRNMGAEKAVGDYLVFLSVFLVLPEGYIDKLKDHISENKFDYSQHPVAVTPGVDLDFFQKFLGNQTQRMAGGKATIPIKQSLFTAALVKKDVFVEVGGFDATMKHYGGHEMDIVYRMDKAGYRERVLTPSITLNRMRISDHRKTVSRLREYGRTGLPNLLEKHPELGRDILSHPHIWTIASALFLGKAMESFISSLVMLNIKLPKIIYRLYLHLIVRNAWDSR